MYEVTSSKPLTSLVVLCTTEWANFIPPLSTQRLTKHASFSLRIWNQSNLGSISLMLTRPILSEVNLIKWLHVASTMTIIALKILLLFWTNPWIPWHSIDSVNVGVRIRHSFKIGNIYSLELLFFPSLSKMKKKRASSSS